MTENTPAVAVIVVTYNSRDRVFNYLRDFADAFRQTDIRHQIVIVDNASTDGTTTELERMVPDATLIQLEVNVGFAAACNLGARAARAPWLWFCNDDLVADRDALLRLWASRSRERCLVPVVRGADGDLQNAVVFSWRRWDLKIRRETSPRTFVAYPVGCCLLLHREAFFAAGAFDERFFPAYYEDAALGVGLWATGTPIQMEHSAVITHHTHGGSPTRTKTERIRRLVFKQRWLFTGTVLTGWRRVCALTLGLPRTALETMRLRSRGPLVGYLLATRALLGAERRPSHAQLDRRVVRTMRDWGAADPPLASLAEAWRRLPLPQGSARRGTRLRLSLTAAPYLRRPLRLIWNEHVRRPPIATYRLRSNPAEVVVVRPRTGDLETFAEIFHERHYEPPEEIVRRLRALPRNPRVLDLGANVGMFPLFLAARLERRLEVISVEADPDTYRILERCRASNGGIIEWQLRQGAALRSEGEVAFVGGQGPGSHVAGTGRLTVPSIPVRALDSFTLATHADVVKIDIEGSEWDLLRDHRFSALGAIAVVLEFHQVDNHLSPAHDAVRALREHGFRSILRFDAGSHGVVWGLRP